MERFAQKELKEWFFKKRRKPLLLRGARQVGKSTLVKLFTGENNLELHEINLERHLYLDAEKIILNSSDESKGIKYPLFMLGFVDNM